MATMDKKQYGFEKQDGGDGLKVARVDRDKIRSRVSRKPTAMLD